MNRRFCALLAASVVACSGGSEPTSNPPTVASITLTGAPVASLVSGETAQLQAVVTGSDGAVMPGQTISWTSSTAAVASVTASGLVTAVGAGQAVITASAGARSATVTVTVAEGATIGAEGGSVVLYGGSATLAIPAQALNASTRIEISTPSQFPSGSVIPNTPFSIGPGTFNFSRAVVLTWRYDPSRLPAGVTEASLTLYVAANSNWAARTTQVDTVANTVTAFLGSSGVYAFVVKPVTFVALRGVMPELGIGVGQKRTFEVRTFDTTATEVVGRVLTWTSSNTARATVNAAGEITGVSPGDVTVTVTCEGISAAVSLTVLPQTIPNWSNVAEWTTALGSPRRTSFVDVTVDLAAIRQLWTVATGAVRDPLYSGSTFGPIAVGGGNVILSNGGWMGAFGATTGTKRWSRQAIRYAPAFGHGRVYVQSFDSLLALNVADGTLEFSRPVVSTDVFPDAAPMAVDGAVYTSQGGLRRFNSSTLSQIWSQDIKGPAAIANTLMYTFGTSSSGSGVTAIDISTGAVAFEVPGSSSSLRGRNVVLGDLNNAIGTCGSQFETRGSCLASYDLTNRTQLWELPVTLESTPAVGQGTIYVVRTNFDPEFRTSVEARRESDGQVIWTWLPPAPAPFFSVPHPKGDIIVTRNVMIVGMASGASTPSPNQATWIVDLATRKQVAALPPGRLAISAEGVLYIASGFSASTPFADHLTAVVLK
jgi:hypothetical protein